MKSYRVTPKRWCEIPSGTLITLWLKNADNAVRYLFHQGNLIQRCENSRGEECFSLDVGQGCEVLVPMENVGMLYRWKKSV